MGENCFNFGSETENKSFKQDCDTKKIKKNKKRKKYGNAERTYFRNFNTMMVSVAQRKKEQSEK